MASNFKSVQFSDVSSSGRFDAKYFFLKDKIRVYASNKKISLISLGEKGLIRKITDGEHSGQIFYEEGITFIKNSSVKDFDISQYDGFYISKEKHESLSRSALKDEDVLFTTIGHLGSAAIVPEGFGEANINQNLVKMEINREMMSPYYLAAFLNSSFVRSQIDSLLTGNIQSILTYPKIKEIKVLNADKGFQLEIENLYKESIKYGRQAISKFEDAKQLIRHELKLDKKRIGYDKCYDVALSSMNSTLWTPKYHFPKYINMIKYFQENFTTEPLSELVKYTGGDEVGSVEYNSYLEKKDDDVPFIRTSDIYNYQYDLCPDYFVDHEIYEDLEQGISKGDILFSNDGKIGMISMIVDDEPIIVQSHINILKKKSSKITMEYLYALFMLDEINFYQCDKCTVIQSTIPTLAKRLNEFVVPILDDDVIKKVTQIIKEANGLIAKKKAAVRLMQKRIEELLEEAALGE